MKIEILEVFVTQTDAITTHVEPMAIGIAALQKRTTAVARNNKRGLLSRLLGIIKLG